LCLKCFFFFNFQERIYPENIEASVAVLSKIVIDWKDVSPKLSSEALKATVKNFKAKVSQVIVS
jgi:hypothetical protein